MLFHQNSQKAFRSIMIVVGVLVILSMILLYFPALSGNF
jgi:hypothetical protein